jgi:hypothetical protein
MRLPVRWNFNNVNAVLEVLIEAVQMITIIIQILPQPSISVAYSVSAQYETAVSFLRIPNVDWWSLYWKLALVVAFSLMSSLVFVEVMTVAAGVYLCSLALQTRFCRALQQCQFCSFLTICRRKPTPAARHLTTNPSSRHRSFVLLCRLSQTP